MSDSTKPPLDWLFECILKQAYGHMKFCNEVEMPNPDKYKTENDVTNKLMEDNLFNTNEKPIKQHPIAKHVYFSGIAEENRLPHESPEAIEKYLEFQHKLKASLRKSFNPTPGFN